MVWYEFKRQKPLILVHKIQKQAFRLAEPPFFRVVGYLPKIPVDICWFLRTYSNVAWRMSGKFQRTYNSVAWRMSGKFQRTYNSVAWRMSGKFQRTYSNVAWRMSGKFQRTYIAWHDAWVESSRELTEATEKHVLPPQVHMNVITCPTPPHPCIPAPTGSHRQACHVLPPQVYMNVITCPTPPHPTPPVHTCTYPQAHMNVNTCPTPPHPTPPHPTPPMSTKRHGLLKAVLQLYSLVPI